MKRTLLLTLVLLAALPSVAAARNPIRVAIGDQHASVFDQDAFQRAKFKRVRYLVAWNVMDNATQRLSARDYVKRARAAGLSVFLHISTDDYTIRRRGFRPSRPTAVRCGGSSTTSGRSACGSSASGTRSTSTTGRARAALPVSTPGSRRRMARRARAIAICGRCCRTTRASAHVRQKALDRLDHGDGPPRRDDVEC